MSPSEPWSWAWFGPRETTSRVHEAHRHFRSFHSTTFGNWEPSVDVYETDSDVIVYVALPGIDPSAVTARLDAGDVMISGRRTVPPELRGASIHRMELPQGRFDRRVELPPGAYEEISRSASHGCVVLTVRRSALA